MKMALPAFDETFYEEIFFDPDSEDDFGGFIQADIDSENDVLSRYYHPWLTDFKQSTGPKEAPVDSFEGQLFYFFMNDEIITLFVNETNRYASQVKGKRLAKAGAHID